MPEAPAFVRFFRSVEGHLVSRYGTATPTTSNQLIGARRIRREIPGRENDLIGDVTIEWTDEVVALTPAEAAAFKTEYDGHVRDGALKECTEADYLAHLESERARAAAADAKPAQSEPRDEPAAP